LAIFNQFARPIKSEFGFTETKLLIKVILGVWFVLLVPWLPFATFSGMIFDGGATWKAYTFVWSMWLYPLAVWTAYAFRQRMPPLVLFPLLNIVGVYVA
jgi:hypothetical protein